mmetsp:Transcript_36870/g.73523  ORF Transcript_36870/g.73523 Transcript_36870/m.73523 type:complete len:213 (+) Transcript_36870:664-1302(+)
MLPSTPGRTETARSTASSALRSVTTTHTGTRRHGAMWLSSQMICSGAITTVATRKTIATMACAAIHSRGKSTARAFSSWPTYRRIKTSAAQTTTPLASLTPTLRAHGSSSAATMDADFCASGRHSHATTTWATRSPRLLRARASRRPMRRPRSCGISLGTCSMPLARMRSPACCECVTTSPRPISTDGVGRIPNSMERMCFCQTIPALTSSV